jgi:uncharacterized protein
MVARWVEPGCEQAYEEWARGILREAATFHGFLGGGVLRPGEVGQSWHTVYRFASDEDLHRWEASPERASWLERANTFIELGSRRVSGLETWFELPGRTAPAPPRWKMAFVSWMAVFPLALLFNLLVLPLVRDWPTVARVVLLSVCLVTLMTWVALPNLTRLFSRWLYPRPATTSGRDANDTTRD